MLQLPTRNVWKDMYEEFSSPPPPPSIKPLSLLDQLNKKNKTEQAKNINNNIDATKQFFEPSTPPQNEFRRVSKNFVAKNIEAVRNNPLRRKSSRGVSTDINSLMMGSNIFSGNNNNNRNNVIKLNLLQNDETISNKHQMGSLISCNQR